MREIRTEEYYRAMEDANILKRYSEIKGDPVRMQRAKNYLSDKIKDMRATLRGDGIPKRTKTTNKATVGTISLDNLKY